MIRTVNGIFRKLGREKGIQWIRDYINSRIHSDMSNSEVQHFLWGTKSNYADCENQEQSAIRIFNEQFGVTLFA